MDKIIRNNFLSLGTAFLPSFLLENLSVLLDTFPTSPKSSPKLGEDLQDFQSLRRRVDGCVKKNKEK